MIVINQTDSITYGEQDAPVGIYKPIEIEGDLWVLEDEAEQSVIDLGLDYTKREVLDSEWLPPPDL